MTLLQFKPDGDDAASTTINGVPFSIDALENFHYAHYSNDTISNGSSCYLAFDRFKPGMLDNGTWVHATTCYIPYFGISTRGRTSIVFGVLFGLSIMLTLKNLRKHGAQFLRENRRFRLVGRRWQWYWMLFVAACAMISLFTGVDVDRYYLQQMPIVLQSLFFTLMVPAALAMVWEGTRQWGSWLERQMVDADPYGMPQEGGRSKVDFWAPLLFYLLAWMNFFMTIPRSWTPIQKQNAPEQSEFIAKPAATDNRGKAGAILAVCAWLVIAFSLQHSVRFYRQGKLAAVPRKLLLNMVLLGIRVGYGIAAAWNWNLSIFRRDVGIGWPFGLGYAPLLLIILAYNVAGLVEENEDKQLMAQRIARGHVQDVELHLVKKPNWWDRNMGAPFLKADERLKKMTAEVGGGRPTARNLGRAVEMGNMDTRPRSASRPVQDPFTDGNREEERHLQGSRPAAASETSDGARAVPGQKIRSMLDV